MNHKIIQGSIRCLGLLLLGLMFGCTSFHLTSTPTADIYENGEVVARTPYEFTLSSGQRTLTLKRYGYVEKELLISSLDPGRIHIDLEWIGRTRIETRPPGAKVQRVEDEKELGISPCSLYLSRPERIRVTLSGYETVERDLVPNERYVVDLKPKSGFKSAFYKDTMFVSQQGPVAIYDRVAGERIGTTPVRLNVEAGSALEYRLPGYKSKFDLISRNAAHRIEIVLEPLTRVMLTGPAGTQVYRAGGVESIGAVPYIVEIDGDATYELKKEGYYDKQISVYPGAPSRINADLEEIPYKTIVTDPPGAEVYRLGGLEKLGDAPYKTIIDSERVFEIKKEGYQSSIIGMGPSSPAQLNVPLNATQRDDPDAAAIGTLDSHVIESF